jgi:hypothetical protein
MAIRHIDTLRPFLRWRQAQCPVADILLDFARKKEANRGRGARACARARKKFNLLIEPGVSVRSRRSETFRGENSVRAIVQFARGENMRAIGKFAATASVGGLSCVGLMTEIKDRRDGKRAGLQNKCPIPDIIDLRQCICAVSAANLLQSGYPGHDAEIRERTIK